MPSKSELKKNLKLLKELLEAYPMDLDARMRIARTYRLLGSAEEAVSHYGAVARYLSLAGLPLQAIAVLKELLQIAPRHEETLLFLAKLYARTRAPDGTHHGRVAVPIAHGTPSGEEGHANVVALEQGMPNTATGIWQAIRPAKITELAVVHELDDVGAVVDSDPSMEAPEPPVTPDSSPLPLAHRLSARDEDALSRAPLFASIEPASLAALGHAMVQLRASAGDVLFREGDLGESCVVVTRGTAEVKRTVVEDGVRRQVFVRTLGPGDVAGVFSLVAAGTRQATVTAETDVEYFEIDSNAVTALVMKEPAARKVLLSTLRERLLGTLFLEVPLFRGLAHAEQIALEQAFIEKEFLAGDDLFADFDEVDGMWIVAMGAVDVFPPDSTQALHSLTVGSWITCLAGSEGSTAGLTATAGEDCIALCLSHKKVMALAGGRGKTARFRPGQALNSAVVVGSLRR